MHVIETLFQKGEIFAELAKGVCMHEAPQRVGILFGRGLGKQRLPTEGEQIFG